MLFRSPRVRPFAEIRLYSLNIIQYSTMTQHAESIFRIILEHHATKATISTGLNMSARLVMISASSIGVLKRKTVCFYSGTPPYVITANFFCPGKRSIHIFSKKRNS